MISNPKITLEKQLVEFIEGGQDSDGHGERILAFVRKYPNCLSRSLKIGHVTGSAWVLDEAGDYVLLTHHKFLDRWLQLGGHVDEDETVMEAALREAKEESGIDDVVLVSEAILDVDVHPIPARPHEPAHHHYDVRYLCRANRKHPLVISDESHDVAWVAIDDLQTVNDSESMLRMARRGRDISVRSL